MPSLEFRYVGQDRLPARLSEFDVERYFALTDSDIDWKRGCARPANTTGKSGDMSQKQMKPKMQKKGGMDAPASGSGGMKKAY